jgi:transcriptional regulator with XRE-family HTH domain
MTCRRTLGQQIREWRQHRGLTQAALAERAGLSWIYIAKLEGGARRAPSLPALERIARALRVTVRLELVGRR